VRSTESFETELGEGEATTQEVKLAKTLIDTVRTKAPELDQYVDLYNERLKKLVDAKIAGEEVASPPTEEHRTPVIDFMAAMKESLNQRKRASAGKKLAISSRTRSRAPAKRRKSG
jgi:DNA end-binding protein Ku